MKMKSYHAAVGALLAGLLVSAPAPAQELVFSMGVESGPCPLAVIPDLGNGMSP